MAGKTKNVPSGTNGEVLSDVAERKRHAVSEILQTIERLYKDRPFLAFLLVRDAIHVLDERKTARPWVIGGSIGFAGSGLVVAAARATGLL